MDEPRARTWRKILVFCGLTLLFSSVFYVLGAKLGGDLRAVLLVIGGLMWCPAAAAMATRRLFGESLADLGWSWSARRYAVLAYCLPLAYALPVYVVTWTTGLGGFYSEEFVQATATGLGWSGAPAALVLLGYIALLATSGVLGSMAFSLGEEIGWRGFLVPELTKVTGFFGVGVISGLVWAVWHSPLIIFGGYRGGAPLWVSLTCFTVMVVALGFLFAWIRLRSGSVWPAVIMHSTHNVFIQQLFDPLTADTGSTAYVIGEFGIGLAVTCAVAAFIIYRSGAPKAAPQPAAA